ncbi:hypothetical protein WDV06_20255 [Streptomyces racemochromogenes]|uniref:Uncharacterized protein n=1 Tax=Streptomyces racemochromogenes TaxID=67353 RepID=A0ABW7PG77_9ACTN
MPQADEEGLDVRPAGAAGPCRTGAGRLRTVVARTGLVPAFLVLTVMMVALWLTGMPFLQALTVSTGVKIALVLLELRRSARPESRA